MTWTIDTKRHTNWNLLAVHERLAIMLQLPDWSDAQVKAGHWTYTRAPEPEPAPEPVITALDLDDMLEIHGPLGPFFIPREPKNTSDHVRELTEAVFAGEYDHAELPADVGRVLDIGAGWGAFSTWAQARWPGAQIEAYEPHALAAMYYALNSTGIDTHALHVAAVTSDPGFRLGVSWDWGSARADAGGKRVPTVHPRDLPPCDAMKLDCEGAEADILREYPQRYLDGVRAILVEWHSPELKGECDRIIQARTELRCVREADVKRGYGVSIWVRT